MSEVRTEVTETTNLANVNTLSGADKAVEDRARRMGWVPKEEFGGDRANHWVDARTFVERAEASAPILIERNRALDARLARTEESLQRANTTVNGLEKKVDQLLDSLGEMRDFASKSGERAYKKARADIEAQMREAVAEADVPKFEKARSELEELTSTAIEEGARRTQQETKRQDTTTTTPQETKIAEGTTQDKTQQQQQDARQQQQQIPNPPEIDTFVRNNPWFLQDPVLNAYMQDCHVFLGRNEPGLNLTDNLVKAKKMVMEKFPEKFGINPNRDTTTKVDGGTAGSEDLANKTKKKGYADLPPEAKAQCDKLVATLPPKKDRSTGNMVPYSREEYCEVFFAGEEQ